MPTTEEPTPIVESGVDASLHIRVNEAFVRRGLAGVCSGSALLTLLLFLVSPWLAVSCQGERIATQTGMQIMFGTVSIDEDLSRMSSQNDADDPDSEVGSGPLMLVVLIGLIVAAWSAGKIALGHSSASPMDSGFGANDQGAAQHPGKRPLIGASLALGVLLFYLLFSFPIERELAAQKEENNEKVADNPFGGMEDNIVNIERTGWLVSSVLLCMLATAAGGALVYAPQFMPRKPN